MAQTLKGMIVDGETGQAIQMVTVVNLATAQTVYSDVNGEFSIAAKSGQQIAFSYFGYKTVQKVVPPGINYAEVHVDMYPLSYHLREYTVRPGTSPYQIDSADRRQTFSRALSRQRSSIMSPFSFVAERLSKNSKRIYRFQKSYEVWEDNRFIDSRYTPELVYALTGLQGDSLANFMNANPMPYDYARTATELELKMWIRFAYKQWMRNPVFLAPKEQ